MDFSFISKRQFITTQQKFTIYGLQFDAALQASSRPSYQDSNTLPDRHNRYLPREIRNSIYTLVLSLSDPIHIVDSLVSTDIPSKKFPFRRKIFRQYYVRCHIRLSMLRTCKKVLSEARAIAYYQEFEFWDEEALLVWLRDIGPYNRSHLCGITLFELRTCPDTVTHNVVMSRIAAMLDNSPNLKKIEVVDLKFDGVIDFSKRLKLHRDGQPKLVVTEARHIAEWVFSFFRPLLCSPSFRNGDPQRLSSLLALDAHACWLYKQKAGINHASILTKEMEDEAGASFSEHLELLLERSRKKNLRRRQKKLQRLG
ncbi:hypothetical protein CMEL01_03607 [Colletotrichum melonis]|uniref:Uncharacterized protein n=1 Tax=Colletotrichum melonis TaxID=1209925 RepID=A0AAI9UCP8_9PEZI|nr:hypothetical protein CMEL01_03607 [Colletotrichum melonis]